MGLNNAGVMANCTLFEYEYFCYFHRIKDVYLNDIQYALSEESTWLNKVSLVRNSASYNEN